MLFGFIVCLAAGLAAAWLGGLQHVIGAPLIGMFIGIFLANMFPAKFLEKIAPGAALSAKRLLRIGIILAGGTLSLKSIVGTGASALPIVLAAMAVSFGTAAIIGKLLGVTGKTQIMVGGGTAICGGTAIAAISAMIDAEENETGYAMTSVFLFDILAALLWPYFSAAMHFTPAQFGILGGVAINDVSSVTAAGDTYNTLMGAQAFRVDGISGGELAMIIKLTRVTMLVVLAIVISIGYQVYLQKSARHTEKKKGMILKNIIRTFPFYVVGFLVLAILNTLLDFSAVSIGNVTIAELMKYSYKYLITAALVGVGCRMKLKDLFTKGVKPVLLGGCTWAAVSLTALLYAAAVA